MAVAPLDSLTSLVTPTPSTKHLTDEELKLQYGIHMTSRIQADGEGKEAKWADIDDDEDDWAPESIEWNDGTKISLEHAIPAPSKEAKLVTAPVDAAKAVPTKKKLATHVASSVGPNATVLKVGQNAEKQAKAAAAAAAAQPKGSGEKANEPFAKSPAPPPAKSPWAALPPVNKSPIEITPQPSSQQRGYFPPTGQPQSQAPIASPPAQEISADDFNRNWRDAHSSGPRELYMPSSGRYEAVNEDRRRGSRTEQNFRQPSVLQRPNVNDARGPAEPSAAFQTNRMSNDQERSPWGRRRASSNVSGASGQFGRRMSVGKGLDARNHPGGQQPYQAYGPPRGMSPAQLSVENRQPSHDSPRLSHVSSEAVSSPVPIPAEVSGSVATQDDPILVQKRIMAEKIEQARRRRQEEEEREEAAKKERIRLKLASLGPAPTKQSTQKSDNPKMPSSDEPAMPSSKPTELQLASSEVVAAAPLSPPKPPVPEATGEPKQYGMMKVHHPDNVKRMMPPPTTQSQPQQRSAGLSPPAQRASVSLHEPHSDPVRSAQSSLPGNRQKIDDVVQLDQSNESPSNDRVNRSWNHPIGNSQAAAPWTASRIEQQATKVSLWGSANNSLGNGTFDRGLAEFGGSRGQLPPIGQPARPTLWAAERSQFPSMDPSQPAGASLKGSQDRAVTTSALPSPDEKPLAADSEADSMPPISRPMPIGPPQIHAPTAAPPSKGSQTGVAAWNNFHNIAAQEDCAAGDRYRQDLAAHLEEEARTGARPASHTAYNETWRQVDPGDQAGQRQVVGVTRSTNASSPMTPFSHLGQLSQEVVPKQNTGPAGTPRASRFFPHGGANGIAPQERRAVTMGHSPVPRSPSPPPPEQLGHPAFAGNEQRPLVSLPKPRAVVKLPPKEPLATPPPVQRPSVPQTWSAVVGQRAVSNPTLKSDTKPEPGSQSWQSRFNALLDKKELLPERRQALAVTSSTRDVLDVLAEAGMTVSLPSSDQVSLADQRKVTSKDVEEEDAIFEDRIAGSLPVVKVPWDVSATILRPMASMTWKRRAPRNIDASTVEPTDITTDPSELNAITIHLPGTGMSSKLVSTKRSSISSAPSKSTKFPQNKPRRGPKSRESSGSFKQQPLSTPRANTNSPHGARSHTQSPRSGGPHHSTHGFKGGPRQPTGLAH